MQQQKPISNKSSPKLGFGGPSSREGRNGRGAGGGSGLKVSFL
jgi:hypothetical protein